MVRHARRRPPRPPRPRRPCPVGSDPVRGPGPRPGRPGPRPPGPRRMGGRLHGRRREARLGGGVRGGPPRAHDRRGDGPLGGHRRSCVGPPGGRRGARRDRGPRVHAARLGDRRTTELSAASASRPRASASSHPRSPTRRPPRTPGRAMASITPARTCAPAEATSASADDHRRPRGAHRTPDQPARNTRMCWWTMLGTNPLRVAVRPQPRAGLVPDEVALGHEARRRGPRGQVRPGEPVAAVLVGVAHDDRRRSAWSAAPAEARRTAPPIRSRYSS